MSNALESAYPVFGSSEFARRPSTFARVFDPKSFSIEGLMRKDMTMVYYPIWVINVTL